VIVVDSSVWIALLRGEVSPGVERLRGLSDTSEILVGDIVLFEVLRGGRDEVHAAAIDERMNLFAVVPMLTPQLAMLGARHYRELRRRGITVRKAADVVIATFCIAHGHHLLHQDRDFDPFVAHCGLLLA
jgi:predicted nucleic acid-binding protein